MPSKYQKKIKKDVEAPPPWKEMTLKEWVERHEENKPDQNGLVNNKPK